MKAIDNSILLDHKKQQVKVRAKSAFNFSLFPPNYNEFLHIQKLRGALYEFIVACNLFFFLLVFLKLSKLRIGGRISTSQVNKGLMLMEQMYTL